jgi:pyruvate dehydrogenase E2 component (dihydrolipoamide acetyltransferase)
MPFATPVTDILMPRLTDSMEEGTIAKWLKQVGDQVAVGEELVEIETDKATIVYESEHAGSLLEIVVAADSVAPIGAVIARVGEPGAELPPPPADAEAGAEEAPAASASAPARIVASPLARRLAAQHGVDLASISGSGPRGRITKADVESARAGAPAQPAAEPATETAGAVAPGAPQASAAAGGTARGETTTVEPSSLQRTIALRMSQSKASAPHFTLAAAVDATRLVEARGRIKAAAEPGEVVPSFNDIVVKAVAVALRRFPRANGAFVGDRFELYSRVNVGVAVAAQDALVVPTIFDADAKSLTEIAVESRRLAEAVRTGSVTPAELEGGTFTITNLGMFGIDSFQPVINPPQAAILAVGAIVPRPVVRDGAVAVAELMNLNLACDHRILYGAEGARFLDSVRAALEEPLKLVQ